MESWAKAAQGRGPLVVFASRRDEVIKGEHPVRVLNEILSRIDWPRWEAGHDLAGEQLPIHPRVLVSAIWGGLAKKVSSLGERPEFAFPKTSEGVCRLAVSILRRDTTTKLGAKHKRFQAALDPNDILEVLKRLTV